MKTKATHYKNLKTKEKLRTIFFHYFLSYEIKQKLLLLLHKKNNFFFTSLLIFVLKRNPLNKLLFY